MLVVVVVVVVVAAAAAKRPKRAKTKHRHFAVRSAFQRQSSALREPPRSTSLRSKYYERRPRAATTMRHSLSPSRPNPMRRRRRSKSRRGLVKQWLKLIYKPINLLFSTVAALGQMIAESQMKAEASELV